MLVVAVSEAAKRSTLLGALIASLPLTSLLAMIWLYVDTGDAEKVASLASSILWLVLPSLILFIVLPVLIRLGWGFWPSLAMASALTVAGYLALVRLLGMLGVPL